MKFATFTNESEQKEAIPSAYRPEGKAKEVYIEVLKNYEIGWNNLFTPRAIFNNRSLIEEINRNRKFFNTFQKPKSEDPDYAWKSNAISPATRNKVISIAAHLTGAILYPNIYAQNDRQDEDKEAAKVMRDLMEWVVENSKYAMTFLYAVISACVNPAVILHQEYVEVFKKIKKIKEDGSWEASEILDEALSGFIQSIVPCDELLIENFFEEDVQKQGFLIRRKPITYNLAKRKYGTEENFKYVTPGIEILYSAEHDSFYQGVTDNDIEVEEVWYYDSCNDSMILFLNGILISDPDRPNPREDKLYPFAKTIYEPADENGNCFYGKSLVNKLGPDQEVIDVLYQMIVDGTYLDVFKPIVIASEDGIDSSIVAPAKVTVLNKDASVNPISVNSNLQAGYNTKAEVERSMAESSTSPQQQGISQSGSQTAFEISKLEENAQKMLGLFGKMIGFLVRDLGVLIGTDIIQYLTVGEMKQISGKDTLTFKKFNLNKNVKGKRKTRTIEFDMNIPEEMTEEELQERSFELLDQEGGMEGEKEIIKVLPGLFRNRKFLFKVEADNLTVKSEYLKRALNLELYDRAIANPALDPTAVTRDFLLGSYEQSRDKTDEYMAEQKPMAEQAGIAQGQTSKLVNQITNPNQNVAVG